MCLDAAFANAKDAIQVLGGIGYTWEHEAHLFYKRAKRLAGQYGDVDTQRERIAAITEHGPTHDGTNEGHQHHGH